MVSQEILIGEIYGAVAAIFFSLILIWLNYQFVKMHGVNFAIAYVLCFLVAYGLATFTVKL